MFFDWIGRKEYFNKFLGREWGFMRKPTADDNLALCVNLSFNQQESPGSSRGFLLLPIEMQKTRRGIPEADASDKEREDK